VDGRNKSGHDGKLDDIDWLAESVPDGARYYSQRRNGAFTPRIATTPASCAGPTRASIALENDGRVKPGNDVRMNSHRVA
jgi:hypothetical protein